MNNAIMLEIISQTVTTVFKLCPCLPVSLATVCEPNLALSIPPEIHIAFACFPKPKKHPSGKHSNQIEESNMDVESNQNS